MRKLEGKVRLVYNNKIRGYVKASQAFTRKAESIHQSLAAGVERVEEKLRETVEEVNRVVDMFA